MSDRGGLDYFLPKPSPFGFCPHAPKAFLFGYCALRTTSLNKTHPIKSHAEHVKVLEDRIINVVAQSDSRWLTFAHINFPGHTSIYLNYLDTGSVQKFIATYQERLVTLDSFVATLVRAITEHDPEAVIVMWGDHGAWLTRGALPEDRTFVPHVRKIEQRLIDLDRTNITVAVYPADFCKKRIGNGYNSKDIAVDVVTCLSED